MLSLRSLQVSAVIDWQFAYAAPIQFTRAAPWWLLLHSPEAWEGNLGEFFDARYMPRFDTWLRALREVEKTMIGNGELHESQQLSGHMEQSLTNGWLWICIAARYSSMFDDVYWEFLDRVFFGALNSVDERVKLLTTEEQEELGDLYKLKMEQANSGEIEDNYGAEIVFWM